MSSIAVIPRRARCSRRAATPPYVPSGVKAPTCRAAAAHSLKGTCPPAVSSAPNGMWCRRRTKGFMSPRASVSEATPSRFLEERASSLRERAQSAQRHLRPLRAARELAPQIAERGIELEQREERCHLLERCVQTRPARDLVVGREEYTACLALPFIELRLPARALLRRDQRALL